MHLPSTHLPSTRSPRRAGRALGAFIAATLLLGVAGCGGDANEPAGASNAADASADTGGGTPRLVGATEAAALVDAAATGLVLLDVRTPEEFAEGHLEGAVLIDYNAADFRAKLEPLDRTVPYLVYCRSGNRSAGAVALMNELGFTTITEMDGGIQAWSAAGLPIVTV